VVCVLVAACSSTSPLSTEEYEQRVEEIMQGVEQDLAKPPGNRSDLEDIEDTIESNERALSELEEISPPEKYQNGHELLIRYYEKSVELFSLFAESEQSGVDEGDVFELRTEYEQLTIETFTLLEEAGRELPFLEIGDVIPSDATTTDPGLIPDLRPADVHYEVRLRNGESVPVRVTYMLPDGSEETEDVRTPWSSDPFTFETGSTMRFRAEASESPPSNLDCVFVAEDPEEGQYAYGPQGDLPQTECFGEYELGLWPPNDDDPINNPLIRVS
jgi:hypothetical protein